MAREKMVMYGHILFTAKITAINGIQNYCIRKVQLTGEVVGEVLRVVDREEGDLCLANVVERFDERLNDLGLLPPPPPGHHRYHHHRHHFV